MLVVGAGAAGLVAAKHLAATGRRVIVVEAAPQAGGMVGHLDVDSVRVDSGAESFATRGGSVAALATELGLGEDLVTPVSAPARIHPGITPDVTSGTPSAYSLPPTGVFGIPTDFSSPGLLEALGHDGLQRAREDLNLDPEVGADASTFAELVHARMGAAVLERLVRPIIRGVHSIEPEQLGTDALIPNLTQRLAKAGSLCAALADVRAAAPAGSAVLGIAGGVHRLVEALADTLQREGVEVRLGTAVMGVAREGSGWLVKTAGSANNAIRCDEVVLACAPKTWSFLDWDSPLALAARAFPDPGEVELITLVLHSSALAEHPHSGVLVAAPGTGAKALTYTSAKWEWVARAAGRERTVLRLSYNRDTAVDGPTTSEALADAGRLLGIAIDDSALLAAARVTWRVPRTPVALGMAEAASHMRSVVGDITGLEVAGAWIDGTGLASVIPGAERAVERLVHDAPTRT